MLSSHVGSRWYRSPEIILVDKNYDMSADIWSVSTVLYELLKKLSNQHSGFERPIMFRGQHCYPLTPAKKDNKVQEFGHKDQINCIIDKLGALSEEDLGFISNKDAITHCISQKIDEEHKQNFDLEMAEEDQNLVDLLNSMT